MTVISLGLAPCRLRTSRCSQPFLAIITRSQPRGNTVTVDPDDGFFKDLVVGRTAAASASRFSWVGIVRCSPRGRHRRLLKNVPDSPPIEAVHRRFSSHTICACPSL
jgi:hypothetical protein